MVFEDKHLLSNIISQSKKNISNKIKNDGHSVYELEADVTIPAEYILMMHFLGEIDLKIEEKIKNYILKIQNEEGGWPLFFDGESNLSATVKAYFALKLSGLNENNKNMLKAKKLIIEKGGAERSNVFTKILLCMFGEISWNTIPSMPIEIMNLPKWFPFNLQKISYWSRTVLVPLLIILHKRPIANNPTGKNISELIVDKSSEKVLTDNKSFLSIIFYLIDKILKKTEAFFPQKNKEYCLNLAYDWICKRLNSEDGLGAIFPAMVNALVALNLNDSGNFKKEILIARQAIDKLLIIKKDYAYCQPCVSPVWDTGWVAYGMIENNVDVTNSIEWLLSKEVNTKGDWSISKPGLKPGGWAFQYNNSFYPDVDDSALVGMVLDRFNRKKPSKKVSDAIERTRLWIKGMQSKNGGWGSFDCDNTFGYLNKIPFADHGALLDPPTVDVTARCLSFLAQLDNKKDHKSIKKATKYILAEQEKDGSWFGRWGTNYIYGTWSALSALNLINFENKEKVFYLASKFLKTRQREDGGWGEDGATYDRNHRDLAKVSTPSQTAWAILGLIAAGQMQSKHVKRGISYLTNLFSEKKNWEEKYYTAVGFPKVFYLKYHGYAEYFPFLAVSRYKNLMNLNYQKNSYGV
tara:strand:- start:2909 stop:4813 length:1905 start_codon:yes stop_codon:yes gene_type:complete